VHRPRGSRSNFPNVWNRETASQQAVPPPLSLSLPSPPPPLTYDISRARLDTSGQLDHLRYSAPLRAYLTPASPRCPEIDKLSVLVSLLSRPGLLGFSVFPDNVAAAVPSPGCRGSLCGLSMPQSFPSQRRPKLLERSAKRSHECVRQHQHQSQRPVD
jgi:hypothetical protein